MKIDFKNILLLLSIFAIGFFLGGYYFQGNEIIKPQGVDFSPFYQAWGEIETKFYNYSEKMRQDMLYGAIQGLVDSLKDPYSDFLSPEETAEFEENLTGTYEGIGAEIGIRDETLTIISPLKGSPAEKAGLLPGDKVLEIDSSSTQDMNLTQAVMKIRGKTGIEVKLKVKRGEKIWIVTIKRAKIEIPTLDFKIIDNNVAYIQLYNFYEDAPSKFKKITQDILNKGVKKIILDLRNNPGGYLSVATDIANFFIKEGKIIVKEDLGKGKSEDVTSKGPGVFANFKIIVLINEGSASASEILAGALAEQNEKTILIGEKTFGKGTVQEFISLQDSSSLKLTVARWLLPSGKSIEGNGITPDIKVKMTEEDIKAGRDPQLKRAIREINE